MTNGTIQISRELWSLLVRHFLLQETDQKDVERIRKLIADKAERDAARKVYKARLQGKI